jgi:CDP-diacylglycerol--glycerol-3-phosphate 3-phosphatidyltransferase
MNGSSQITAPQGLYVFKSWYSGRLARPLALAVDRQWSPDALTAVGVLAAVLAAAAVLASASYPPAGVAVLPLLALRLAGANLDGALARARGVSRPWGFVVNELGDRLSDIVVLAALTVHVGTAWAAVAVAAASLPTFVSLAVAGAGGGRDNGGPVGKTERCLLLALAGLCAAAGLDLWSAATALIVAGGLVTAGFRLRAGHRRLSPSTPVRPLVTTVTR